MDHQLTEAAAQDIADILRATARQFGQLQRRRYAALIERAIRMVAEDPERPGSRQRDELANGVRSLSMSSLPHAGKGPHRMFCTISAGISMTGARG